MRARTGRRPPAPRRQPTRLGRRSKNVHLEPAAHSTSRSCALKTRGRSRASRLAVSAEKGPNTHETFPSPGRWERQRPVDRVGLSYGTQASVSHRNQSMVHTRIPLIRAARAFERSALRTAPIHRQRTGRPVASRAATVASMGGSAHYLRYQRSSGWRNPSPSRPANRSRADGGGPCLRARSSNSSTRSRSTHAPTPRRGSRSRPTFRGAISRKPSLSRPRTDAG